MNKRPQYNLSARGNLSPRPGRAFYSLVGQSGLECARTHAMSDRTYIVQFTRLKYALSDSLHRAPRSRGNHIVLLTPTAVWLRCYYWRLLRAGMGVTAQFKKCVSASGHPHR